MLNLNFSTSRAILACMFACIGMALTGWLTDFWPYIYPSTQWAFTAMGLAFAFLALVGGASGGARRLLLFLVVLAMLTWAAIAFFEIGRLISYALTTIGAWRKSGASPGASFQAGLAVFHNLTPAQTRACFACLIVGFPPVALLFSALLASIQSASRSRVSKSGPWNARWMDEAKISYLRGIKTGLPLGNPPIFNGDHL